MLLGLSLLILLCTNYRVESSPFESDQTHGDGAVGAWESLESLIKSSESEGSWHSEASIVPSSRSAQYEPFQWFSEVPLQNQPQGSEDQTLGQQLGSEDPSLGQEGSVDPQQPQLQGRVSQPETQKQGSVDQSQGSEDQEQGPEFPWHFQPPQQPYSVEAQDPQPPSFAQRPNQPMLGPRAPAALQPLNHPMFTKVLSPIPSSVFKPEGGTRPLPPEVVQMLLPPAPTKITLPPYGPVDVLCHLDRIYVRIKKVLFSSPSAAWQYLKVGTCPVNEDTPEHYYFLYYLKGCGLKFEDKTGYSTFSNTLTYNPPNTGPILRDLPFSVGIICKYYKHFNAYAIGYHPEIKSGTVFARLTLSSQAGLKPYDQSWNPVNIGQSFTIGKPMHFAAKVPGIKAGERTYLNKCFITPTNTPNSAVKYSVIENNGCMVDGKVTVQSKFIPYADKTIVRFSIGAFVFKDSTQLPTGHRTLYLHCEIAVGPETPSPSAKACSYDKATKRWKALFGADSLCACCDSTCPSSPPKVSRAMVSSDPWKMDTEPSAPQIEKDEETPEVIEPDEPAFDFGAIWGGN